MDFADARRRMVDGQLRPNKVTEPRLLAAMREVPRERFLPAGLASRAYADESVPLPGGRGMLQPMVLARMLQLMQVRAGARVLVVAAGAGYAAAVLAHMGASVVALEDDVALATEAARVLDAVVPAGAVRVVTGSLRDGASDSAPFDAILVEGMVEALPESLSGQLAEGGRLACLTGGSGRAGRAMLGQRVGGTFSMTAAFDATGPQLQAFAPAPGFAL